MTALFEHTDGDGDTVQVRTAGLFLRFTFFSDGCNEGSADMGVADVDRLHTVLGEWLACRGQELPSAAPIRIKEWIQEEVARVLPLRLAPQAEDDREPCGVDPVPVPVLPGGPIIPLQGYCTCGHTKWAHNNDGLPQCQVAECTCKLTRAQVRGFETVPVSAPRLMSEVRKRVRSAECTCVHSSKDHHAPGNGWEGGCPWCQCQWDGVQR